MRDQAESTVGTELLTLFDDALRLSPSPSVPRCVLDIDTQYPGIDNAMFKGTSINIEECMFTHTVMCMYVLVHNLARYFTVASFEVFLAANLEIFLSVSSASLNAPRNPKLHDCFSS